jgi:hypothetical protein
VGRQNFVLFISNSNFPGYILSAVRALLFNERREPVHLDCRSGIGLYLDQSNCHTSKRRKNMEMKWWLVLIALLILVIVGGAILRWEFWTGVF